MKNTKKRQFIKRMTVIALAAIIGFSMAACDDDNSNNISVILKSVTANGSSTQTTTQLTLTFDKAITPELSAADITLSGISGVTKGTISGTNPYTLYISGFTSGGTLNVAVLKSDYKINDSPKTVDIYYYYNFDVDIVQISGVNLEMVKIPGGSFEMGDYYYNEQDVHTVTLSGFYMGRTEVTQEQWRAVMGNNPSFFPSSPASGEVQSKRPVEQVSWYDTLVFCNKLSVLKGLSPAYSISGSTDPAVWGLNYNPTWDAVEIAADSNGYRLPNEEQWEYAAKGGDGSPGNYTYSGNDSVDNVAWYNGNSGNKTHEVGKKAHNGLGLYDMSGNVYEWCWDLFFYGNSNRVGRGGSWIGFASETRPFIRVSADPNISYFDIGFRLVRP